MSDQENGREPGAEPDIDGIMEMLAPGGAIDKAAKKQSEGLTEMGAAFKRIEKDLNGNRAAVSFIRRLDKMSEDKRADFLRTAEPLLVERGYTLDAIDGNDLIGSQKAAGAGAPADDDDDDDDDDADAGGDAEPNPLRAATAALTGGPKKLSIVTPSESKH